MNGILARTLLASLPLLLAASADSSPLGVPSGPNSTVPAYIDVVGTTSGVPDARGSFVVVVRDFANNPIANSTLVLDFLGCTDMNLCRAVVGGVLLDCPTRTVRAITDAAGQVRFAILGAGRNNGGLPGPGAGCMGIFADGVLLRHTTPTEFDLNGAVTANGVDVTDLSAWLRDFGLGPYWGRSDFNHDGLLGVVDLAVWLGVQGAGTSSSGCYATTYCP